jgi:hypothetical protein
MLNLRFARAMLQYLDESQQQGPHPFVVLDLAARQERGPNLLLELLLPYLASVVPSVVLLGRILLLQ